MQNSTSVKILRILICQDYSSRDDEGGVNKCDGGNATPKLSEFAMGVFSMKLRDDVGASTGGARLEICKSNT